jgi:hypothetical protein
VVRRRNVANAITYGTMMGVLGIWSLSRGDSPIMGILAIGLAVVAVIVFLGPFGSAVKCRACGLQWNLRKPPTAAQLKARASMIAAKRQRLRQAKKQAK